MNEPRRPRPLVEVLQDALHATHDDDDCYRRAKRIAAAIEAEAQPPQEAAGGPGYAPLYLDGGGDPSFEQIDAFLQAHFGARAVYSTPDDAALRSRVEELEGLMHSWMIHEGHTRNDDCDLMKQSRRALTGGQPEPEGDEEDELFGMGQPFPPGADHDY